MHLYADVKYIGGTEERVPIIANEPLTSTKWIWELEIDIVYIHSRDDLDERRYRQGGLREVLMYLREGDQVTIKTEAKSYSDVTGVVVDDSYEPVIETESGKRYRAWPEYDGKRTPAEPWLRTDDHNESRGIIEEVEVHRLNR